MKQIRAETERPAVAYAIRCNKTGRVYIGVTSDFHSRVNTHFRELKARQKRGVVKDSNGRQLGVWPEGSNWQMDYDNHGRESFDVYILEENIPKAKREEREDYWIDKYKAADPKYGYNHRRERAYKVQVTEGLPPFPDDMVVVD